MRLNDVSALQAQFVLSSPSGICELTCTQPPTNLAGEFLWPAITLQIVGLWIVENARSSVLRPFTTNPLNEMVSCPAKSV